MKKNTMSYSTLRDSEAKTQVNFYNDLAIKTLRCIGMLTSYDLDKFTTISKTKSTMGINFNALAKIISALRSTEYVRLHIDDDLKNNKNREIGPDDLKIYLTNNGLRLILKDSNTSFGK